MAFTHPDVRTLFGHALCAISPESQAFLQNLLRSLAGNPACVMRSAIDPPTQFGGTHHFASGGAGDYVLNQLQKAYLIRIQNDKDPRSHDQMIAWANTTGAKQHHVAQLQALTRGAQGLLTEAVNRQECLGASSIPWTHADVFALSQDLQVVQAQLQAAQKALATLADAIVYLDLPTEESAPDSNPAETEQVSNTAHLSGASA